MPLLPRNQLHLIPINRIVALYRGLFDNNIFNRGNVVTSASFKEDMNAIMKYFNGIIEDSTLNEYLQNTKAVDEEGNELDRETIFFVFLKELENITQELLPEFVKYPQEFIYFEYDEDYLYILDRRRKAYVPAVLHRAIKARTNASIFTDPGW